VLNTYRRHLVDCRHALKGQAYTLCKCPIWCDGTLKGKRVRRSLGTNDAATALKKVAELESGQTSAAVSVAAAAAAFLSVCADRNLKESTITSYRKTLDHLISVIGGVSIEDVAVPVLDKYQAGRAVAPATWRKELETIRALFSFCIDREWCEKNPAKKMRMPMAEELVTAPFESAEIARLIAATDQLFSDDPGETGYVQRRARALVYALLYSGLRISDVAGLERSALNGRHLTLRVLKTGVRQKVLLHSRAAEALLTLPARDPRYFFWSGNGEIITCIKNLRRTIYRLGKIADVKAHPHRFRDTFAVELLTQGADIRTVQQLLGHRSVRVTERHYAHFVAAHQQLLDDAAALLDFERSAAPVLLKTRKRRQRNA
jgi:site-specific recombinase XerD